MEPRNQLVACIIKQYGTGLYQAWVSLDKGHTACLGSHHDEAGAAAAVDFFFGVLRGGQIKTHKNIFTHIDSNFSQKLGTRNERRETSAARAPPRPPLGEGTP